MSDSISGRSDEPKRIQIDLRLVYEIDDPTVTEDELREFIEQALPPHLRDDRQNLRAWRRERLMTETGDWRSYPEWKRDLAQSVHKAVYSAAIGMSDEEVEAVVRDALNTARRHLSS